MRFTSFVATAFFAAVAFAAPPNPFTMDPGFSVTAGKPVELTWTPTDGNTVTIVLRQGTSNDLTTLTTVAAGTQNDGEYTWNVPADSVRGTDYVFEIINDDDESDTNYSAYFTLESDNTVATTTSGSSTSSASSSSSTSSTMTTKASVSITMTHSFPTMTHSGNSTMSHTTAHSTVTKSTPASTTKGPSSTGGSGSPTQSTGGGETVPSDAAVALNRNSAGMLALAVAGAVIAL